MHQLAEIQQFFKVYKDLEPGKASVVGEWSNRAAAIEAIAADRARFL
jgi:inorganic pyrophosphatase